MVIDSHVHVWDPSRIHYPWMVDTPTLHRRYDVHDVDDELRAVGVRSVVLVQAADHPDDTRLMLEIAESNPRVAGVVGWIPLLDPVAAEQLLDEWSERPVVGVRHLIHRDPNPDLLADTRVDAVMTMLAERSLTFDVCAESDHLLRLVPSLADRHQNLTLVIDHLGKPPIADRGWQPWADSITAAAAAPNTVVKLSGLNTAARPTDTADEYRRYVDHAIAVFGADRVMYGGDWPFALLAAASYRMIWEPLRTCLDMLDPQERDHVLGGVARSTYRLSRFVSSGS